MAWNGMADAAEREAMAIARRTAADLWLAGHLAEHDAMMQAASQAYTLANREADRLRTRREIEADLAVVSTVTGGAERRITRDTLSVRQAA